MLRTDRCDLYRLQETDYEDVIQLYRNHQVRKYLGGATDNEVLLSNKFYEVLTKSKKSYYWVVRSVTNIDFIGLISLDKYHDDINIEISYEFLPAWWGNGIATEVINAIIGYSFNELDITRLVAETQTANIASCRVLEKAGMTLENKLYRFNAEQSLYSLEKNK